MKKGVSNNLLSLTYRRLKKFNNNVKVQNIFPYNLLPDGFENYFLSERVSPKNN